MNFGNTDIDVYTLFMTERDGIYEWDRAKAESNWLKHGVSFQEAQKAFADPQALEIYDEEHSLYEHRFSLIGYTGERLLVVIFKETNSGSVRLISAREPDYDEQEEYEKNLITNFSE
jgi:uncharacterized DUF497 family protein